MDSAKGSQLVVSDCSFKHVAFVLHLSKLVPFSLRVSSAGFGLNMPILIPFDEYTKQNCNVSFSLYLD